MTAEEIIKKLREGVIYCDGGGDDRSWGMEYGVLITKNEALSSIKLLDSLRWRDPKVELPEVQNNYGVYENEDLVIVKLSKYDSYEFGVLIMVNGKLEWDIQSVGVLNLDEVIGWKPIE